MLGTLPEDPGSVPAPTPGSSRLPVTPAPEHTMSSSGLCRQNNMESQHWAWKPVRGPLVRPEERRWRDGWVKGWKQRCQYFVNLTVAVKREPPLRICLHQIGLCARPGAGWGLGWGRHFLDEWLIRVHGGESRRGQLVLGCIRKRASKQRSFTPPFQFLP